MDKVQKHNSFNTMCISSLMLISGHYDVHKMRNVAAGKYPVALSHEYRN